jgi:O-antigen/teichoic acid export membrane protein
VTAIASSIDVPRSSLAKSGLLSFAGSAVSAAMGFVLTIVFARTLGNAGSGLVLQAIAVFTIALSIARIGMDSASVWILPRLAVSNPRAIRGTVSFLLVSAGVGGTVCAIVLEIFAPLLDHSSVVEAVRVSAPFLPIAAVLLVALAATRALGGVLPYVTVGSVALPTVRPIAVGIAATAGASATGVMLAWALPLPVALVAALLVLAAQMRVHERSAERSEVDQGTQQQREPSHSAIWRIDETTRAGVIRYAVPRTVSAGLEQSIIWLDVLIVGILLGPAPAGIYGAASRFVAAGLIVDSAIRVVISPTLSRLLFEKDMAKVQALYRRATTWLVLFGTPAYVLLGVFATVILDILGPGFRDGALPLQILCLGAIITFLAGNIHSVLLLSGRSGWGALNKAVVLGLNVIGNLTLVPLIGITGAAISWAVSMLADAILAVIEVRRFIGTRIEISIVLRALIVPLITVGAPAILIRWTLGATATAFLIAASVSVLLFGFWCFRHRTSLGFEGLSKQQSTAKRVSQ